MANKKKIVMMLCILFQSINIYDQSVAMADIGLLVGGSQSFVVIMYLRTGRGGDGTTRVTLLTKGLMLTDC